MRKNIRQIKQELRNFAKRETRPVRARHFARRWEDDGEEGETLQDKCEIINRILFDGEEKYYLNPEKLLEFLNTLHEQWNVYAVLNGIESCEHLMDVLEYLIGKDKDAKRPKSLAVYEAAEKLREHSNPLLTIGAEEPYDFEGETREYLKDYMEDYFDDDATDAFKEAIVNGETITAKNIEEYDDDFWENLMQYIDNLPGDTTDWEETVKGNPEVCDALHELYDDMFESLWWDLLREEDFDELRNSDEADDARKIDFRLALNAIRETYADKLLGDVIKELSKNGKYKNAWTKKLKDTKNKLSNKIELAVKSLPKTVASHYNINSPKIVIDTKFFTGDLELTFKKGVDSEVGKKDAPTFREVMTKQGLTIKHAHYSDGEKGVFYTVRLNKDAD